MNDNTVGSDNVTAKIMEEYAECKAICGEFSQKTAALLEDLLKDKGIAAQVTYRLKDEESLSNKIDMSNGKYSCLNDITDISGVRVMTYFVEDVEQVATIIKAEFTVDENNSVDKGAQLDPDRFGYLSQHYVVSLSSARKKLPEYKRFVKRMVEIQVRSILQHAWAEIEHDLGYKIKEAVPRDERRNFARLAGLLEIADNEFNHIRQNLQEYRNKVDKEITSSPDQVLLDQTSLRAFLEHNAVLKKSDTMVAKLIGAEIRTNENALVQYTGALSYLGIRTIADLEKKLTSYEEPLLALAERRIGNSNYSWTNAGVSLFYLCFIIAGCAGSDETLNDYMDHCSIHPSKQDALRRDVNYVCMGI